MKYLRLLSTFLMIVYTAHLLDQVYIFLLKPNLNQLSGAWYALYTLFTLFSRAIGGFALGSNIMRINRWIWNLEEDF
ncbi:MAG: hypothetical protein K1X40_13345 [Chitinophagales bacterium]|nr:hypothetical protein [Chitinophagales bacterium]